MATTTLAAASGLAISGPGLPSAASSVSLHSALGDSCSDPPATTAPTTPTNTQDQNPALVSSSPPSPSSQSTPKAAAIFRPSQPNSSTTPSPAPSVSGLARAVVPPVRSGSKTGGLADLIQRPPFDFAINLVIRPQDDATSSSSSSTTTATPSAPRDIPGASPSRNPSLASTCSSAPSLSTSAATAASLPQSLQRRPTEPIPEESDQETESDTANEPLTPISGRQSRDFQQFEAPDNTHHRDSLATTNLVSGAGIPEEQAPDHYVPLSRPDTKAPVYLGIPELRPAPSPSVGRRPKSSSVIPVRDIATTPPRSAPAPSAETLQVPSSENENSVDSNSLLRSKSRNYSSSSLKRAMGIFRRASHAQAHGSETPSAALSAAASPPSPISTATFHEPNYNGNGRPMALSNGNSRANSISDAAKSPSSSRHSRRFSFHRSAIRSNTPPDSDSSTDGVDAEKTKNRISMPPIRFNNGAQNAEPMPMQKKGRANTGLSIRGRVINFANSHGPTKERSRRTRSAERQKPLNNGNSRVDITRSPWAMPPDAGTGMKARRLSLSLPDDFTVDVAELLSEFEYQHKLLGRHGKHLGKGATSKVTLMTRKGSPSEMYAVKEFRGKASNESTSDYEGKIKSEYSIAKSLHHPNIVETIRLCTNHGRWNHVMEYCSEGDLFTLVSKKYLKDEGREMDRMCLFKQVCQGINYLHSNGIAHRDIKLENLLVTKDSKVKITDFGVSEVFSGIHPGLREAGGQCGQGMYGDIRLCKPGICGSLPYIAPEVLSKEKDYDPRALDVWSAAIVMIHLIFNASIWEKADKSCAAPGSPYHELVKGWEKLNVLKETKEELRDSYPKVRAFEFCVKPPTLRRILLNMLNPDPAKRWTMEQVVNHRWMKNVECCQPESYEDPAKYLDASKPNCMRPKPGHKIFCHNHLPLVASQGGLPPMPGKPGY